MGEFVGGRIVPKHCGTWNKRSKYERHYAADWDVLRPAKELAEYSTLTSEDLEELLHEAEKIIEGWPIPDEHGAGESADNGDGESAGVGTECGADVGAGTEENGDRADL